MLSGNAAMRRGGQGVNLFQMFNAYQSEFDLTVFCRDSGALPPLRFVPESRLCTFINKIPILRRRHDWQVLASDLKFDRCVSRQLPKADFFQGVAGQCAISIAKARSNGCRTLLDVLNPHIDDFIEANREAERFGVGISIHPKMRQRTLSEYDNADLIRVMSEYARQTFLAKGFPEERVIAAPPPVKLDEFTPADFSEPKFRVSFVGLFQPWKGFHYLIEAFRRLSVADAELVLWGASGWRPISDYLAEQRTLDPRIVIRTATDVRLAGYENVYGKSSVLVHPSLGDGFAYVVTEAMASGIPVIVTSTTGAAELVVDGKNGYIVPPRDSQAILERLEHLAKSPSLLREMGRAARESLRGLNMD
ncbi:MAG TPA: glycosyltransferase family 4 protein, partial [Terriglobia bacterium]|nr:glycosyltransferase family 4 protein [Terriglobia bacterium]